MKSMVLHFFVFSNVFINTTPLLRRGDAAKGKPYDKIFAPIRLRQAHAEVGVDPTQSSQ